MKLSCALLAVTAGLFLPTALHAQTPAPGSWLRVAVAPDSGHRADRPAVGRLVTRGDGLLVLDRGNGVDTIPEARIRRVDIRTTRSAGANLLHGLGLGAAIGGGIGLLAGAAFHDGYSCSDGGFCVDAGAGALVGGLLGVAVGSVAGLASGSGEHWRRVPMSARLSALPGRHGTLLVGISMRR